MTNLTEAQSKILRNFFEIESEEGMVTHKALQAACKMRGQFIVKMFDLYHMGILQRNINYDTKQDIVVCLNDDVREEFEPRLEWEPIEMDIDELVRRDMETIRNHQ